MTPGVDGPRRSAALGLASPRGVSRWGLGRARRESDLVRPWHVVLTAESLTGQAASPHRRAARAQIPTPRGLRRAQIESLAAERERRRQHNERELREVREVDVDGRHAMRVARGRRLVGSGRRNPP
jgi:hypothetical protein